MDRPTEGGTDRQSDIYIRLVADKNPNLNFKSLLSLSLLSLLPREILCEEDAVVRGHIQPITLYVAYYKDYGIEWYSPTSCITRTNWISLCCL